MSKSRRNRASRAGKIARKADAGSTARRAPQALSLQLLNPDQAARIHTAVKRILHEVGVIIDHAPTQRMLIESHGCRQTDNGYVLMPPDLIDEAVSTVPDRVRLYDRNGDLSVDTSAKTSAYCPGHNCVRLLDHLTGELRPCSVEDIRRTARVCEALPNIDMVGTLGYPTDVPPEDEAVEATRAMLENSRKPAVVLAHDEEIQKRIYDYATGLSGGPAEFAEKPIILELMGPISPLKLPDEFCLRIINCARWHLPVVCYPATFPGMSSPISVAGAIAQSSAEAMAGIVIHQITEPGAPVLSGSAILPMDMRQADLALGSPEYMLNGLGAADYFRSIGIPSWIGAGCSDSHAFDAQAAAEAGASMAIAALARTPFVHNLGFLSGGRTGSLEMLVLCDELVGWSNKMAAGVDAGPEDIAVDVVKRSVADNSFLTDEHTQSRFLTESWYPNLFQRSNADAWLEEGAKDMKARVADKLASILC